MPKQEQTIENWEVQKTNGGHFRLVSADFENDTLVTTSNIVDANGDQIQDYPDLSAGDTVETKNTLYKLGKRLYT